MQLEEVRHPLFGCYVWTGGAMLRRGGAMRVSMGQHIEFLEIHIVGQGYVYKWIHTHMRNSRD